MKTRIRAIAVVLLLFGASTCTLQAQEITYQGQLQSSGSPVNGLYDFRFEVYDAASGGGPLGNTVRRNPVLVTNGLFTVALDFDPEVFSGEDRWLEIHVRTNGAASFTTLNPRQQLRPTPYALFSDVAGEAGTALQALDVAPNTIHDGSVIDGTLQAQDLGDGQVVKSLNGLRDHVGLEPGANVSVEVTDDTITIGGSDDWRLEGNNDTTPGTHFLGTTDDQPLAFRVNNAEVARLASNGNLGVGLTNPAAKLEVAGTVRATAFEGDGAGLTGLSVTAGVSQIDVGAGMTVSNPTGPTTTLGLSMGHGNGLDADLLDGQHAVDFALSSHGHWGELWLGGSSTSTGLRIQGSVPWNNGVLIAENNNNGPSVWGVNYGTGNAVRGNNPSSGIGVFGQSDSGTGVEGVSASGYGVRASSTDNYALYAETGDNSGHFAGYFKGQKGIITETTAGNYSAYLDNAVRISRSGWHGIQIDDSSWAGIWIDNAGSDGFSVNTAGRHGFAVHSATQDGLHIDGTTTGDAIHIDGAAQHGLHIDGAGGQGVDVAAADGNGVQVYTAGKNGVAVASANWSGVYVASAGSDALRVQTAGEDGLRIFEGVGRDYIRAGSDADVDFKVTKNGTAYADGGWQGAADFAELIVTAGSAASYEPGDVMAISGERDRAVTLSTQAYSTAVIGVYSKEPGFIGSKHPTAERCDGEIPVAITGIVPCKVSTENGPIRRGDLLTSSSMPGHAMKAANPRIGTILGKAMGNLEDGTGQIEILVMLQ